MRRFITSLAVVTVVVGGVVAPAAADPGDPGWYELPKTKGDLRIVNVPAGGDLQGAFDDALPGDTILLGPGVHPINGNLVLRNSGTKKAWIKIKTQPGQPRAIIDLQGSGEFRISGSYVLLKRVVIRNGGGNNLHIAPESGEVRDVVIRKTKIHGLVWGPGAAIKLNRANDYKVRRVWLIDTNVSQAISNAIIDGVAVRKVAARGNKIHDNVVGSHGIFFKGGSSKILIEENRIWGIRQNAALQLGGNTGPNFWDPGFPLWEGVDQVARRNVIFDFDDSAFEIRGVLRGEIYENEVDTQTTFAIFRLQCGNRSGGGQSDNDDISIHDNVITATGNPQYARNDCRPVNIGFDSQTWIGTFHNSGSPGPNIPPFPLPGDTVVP